MSIKVNPQPIITMLDPNFVSVVNDLLKDTSLNGSGIVALNFRDPTYSATDGGFHPVEIHVDSKGDVLSITDLLTSEHYPSRSSVLSSIGASNRAPSASKIACTTWNAAEVC
jgi:hypothetical protein